MWIVLDKIIHTPSSDVALVNDEQVYIWKVFAFLKGLSRAYLDAFMRTMPPMGGLHYPVVDVVFVQSLASLIHQHDTIHHHGSLLKISETAFMIAMATSVLPNPVGAYSN
jgi:hypothetical protein